MSPPTPHLHPHHNQPQRLELIAIGSSSSHFLLNLILMPSRMFSMGAQFSLAKPNSLSSAFKIRVGTQLLFILCLHASFPWSQLLLTPYFMFQTLHSKFNSGVFRILEEIQIFYVQNNSKTFFNIYIKIWSLFPIVILKPSNVPLHTLHIFL